MRGLNLLAARDFRPSAAGCVGFEWESLPARAASHQLPSAAPGLHPRSPAPLPRTALGWECLQRKSYDTHLCCDNLINDVPTLHPLPTVSCLFATVDCLLSLDLEPKIILSDVLLIA